MMFKLKDGITDPVSIRYMERRGGSNVYTHKTFMPGKLYAFDEADETARETLLAYKVKIKSNPKMKEVFDENGIEYKLVKPTCPCQKADFMEFYPVEEVRE